MPVFAHARVARGLSKHRRLGEGVDAVFAPPRWMRGAFNAAAWFIVRKLAGKAWPQAERAAGATPSGTLEQASALLAIRLILIALLPLATLLTTLLAAALRILLLLLLVLAAALALVLLALFPVLGHGCILSYCVPDRGDTQETGGGWRMFPRTRRIERRARIWPRCASTSPARCRSHAHARMRIGPRSGFGSSRPA